MMELHAEILPAGWSEKLGPTLKSQDFQKLQAFLKSEQAKGAQIFPETSNIFRALRALDLDDVKIVILGQDPYHGENQAIGFSFAVPNALRIKPPSLKNIFKEIEGDLGVVMEKTHSDLTGWVEQGVLLLNTIMTVRSGEPLSHRNQGWENFTDQVISALNEREQPVIFILWGAHAQKMKDRINLTHHCVLESVHPSPLSAHRGFFGSRIFTRANAQLQSWGLSPIDWSMSSTTK